MSKPFTVQHAGEISAGILVVGIALFVMGLLDLLDVQFVEVGAWGYWLLGIGAALLIVGIVWVLSYRLSVNKFEKMLEEKSKANFVKKLDDAEYLAWKLPLKFEEQLMSKKREFGVK